MPIIHTGGAKIEKESKLGLIVVIIVSLVSLLIIIISTRASFPVYLFYATFIILLIAIFCLLIYGFSAPMYEFIKKRREIRKHNALARKYFAKFKDFTDRFGELVDPTKRDNIPGALKKTLNSSQEFRNISVLSPQDLYNLFNYFKERLKRFDRTKEDFTLLVKEFGTILNLYNEFCVFKPVKEIRGIGREKVDADTKEKYKKYKGAYERFIGNYTDFEKELNKEFGEKNIIDDFELPGELE